MQNFIFFCKWNSHVWINCVFPQYANRRAHIGWYCPQIHAAANYPRRKRVRKRTWQSSRKSLASMMSTDFFKVSLQCEDHCTKVLSSQFQNGFIWRGMSRKWHVYVCSDTKFALWSGFMQDVQQEWCFLSTCKCKNC